MNKTKLNPLLKYRATKESIYKAEAKRFIDANVWDGEDRTGCSGDSAVFSPDELQYLIDDLLDHLHPERALADKCPGLKIIDENGEVIIEEDE